MNFGFLGRGNTSKRGNLKEQLAGGCLGLKIHEDWGAMPAVIDTCLAAADELAERLGLRHYPVLVTATGIEQ